MEVWKIIFLSKWVICRFHVNLPGCTMTQLVNPGFLPPSTVVYGWISKLQQGKYTSCIGKSWGFVLSPCLEGWENTKKTTRYYGIQWRLDGGSHDGWKKQVLKGSRGSFSGHNMELILMDAQLSSNFSSHHKEPASAPLKKTYEKNGTSYFFGSAQNLLKNLRHFQTASFAVSQAIDFTVSLRMQNMAVVGKVSDFFGERRRGRK